MSLIGAAFGADDKQQAASNATAQWLALVDSGQYAESWFQAASAFRNAVAREQWKNALDSTRAPPGKVVSRQLRNATYTTRLPNAAAGQYAIPEYETSFERAPGMIETITPMLGKDGKWRVSGYVKRSGG